MAYSRFKPGLNISLIFAGLATGLMMFLVCSGTKYLSGNDSFYHVKMALLGPRIFLADSFPWMHWTMFREQFVNHYYGYHLFLSPFVKLGTILTGNSIIGAKLFNLVMASLTGGATYLIMKQRKIHGALPWTLMLGWVPWVFWLRMSYIRAPAANIFFLLLVLLMMLRRRPVMTGLVAFLITHLYSGGFFVLILPLAFAASGVLCGRLNRKTLAVIFAVPAGMVIALFCSPYFPENFAFLWREGVNMVLGNVKHSGSEWRPYNTWFLIRTTAPLATVWLLALTFRLRQPTKIDIDGVALFLVQTVFFLLTAKSRHFIEYWPVFLLVHTADLASPSVNMFMEETRSAFQKNVITFIIVAVIIAGSVPGLLIARKEARPLHDHIPIKAAMDTLKNHSSKGDLVFTDDWDMFPVLFFYNHYNYYMFGLDPIYTSDPYPVLHDRFDIISRGKAPTTFRHSDSTITVQLEDIRNHFQSDYVVVMKDHGSLLKQLNSSSNLFERIYPESDNGEKPAISVFHCFNIKR